MLLRTSAPQAYEGCIQQITSSDYKVDFEMHLRCVFTVSAAMYILNNVDSNTNKPLLKCKTYNFEKPMNQAKNIFYS